MKIISPGWGTKGDSPRMGWSEDFRPGSTAVAGADSIAGFQVHGADPHMKKRFLGIPYVSIAAQRRHIQTESQMQSAEQRA